MQIAVGDMAVDEGQKARIDRQHSRLEIADIGIDHGRRDRYVVGWRIDEVAIDEAGLLAQGPEAPRLVERLRNGTAGEPGILPDIGQQRFQRFSRRNTVRARYFEE